MAHLSAQRRALKQLVAGGQCGMLPKGYGKTEGKEGVMRLDLADLRLFIAIVDTGSITGGAAAAHLALASASERLRKMEAEVGVPLLHRHARGVTTTEAGEVLARHARPLLEQQRRLRQAMHAFARGQQGTLRLFANTSAMSAFLPGKLAAWMAAHLGYRSTPKSAPARILSAAFWRA